MNAIQKSGTNVSNVNVPTLQEVLTHLGPLPYEAVFMGMAVDGMPLLLNVQSMPNILIHNSGNYPLLLLSEVISRKNREDNDYIRVEYIVLTNHPECWEPDLRIIPFYSEQIDQTLLALAGWISKGAGGHNSSVLVLVDDIEAVSSLDFDSKQNFNYVFNRGRKSQVFVVATCQDYINNSNYSNALHIEHKDGHLLVPEGKETLKVLLPRLD